VLSEKLPCSNPDSGGFSYGWYNGHIIMSKLVTLLGPTSTGKTSLAIQLCKKFGGEIISADSRQIYKYADVGTNKERSDEIPIHLYDVVEPDENYSVAHFVEDANKVYDQIIDQAKTPFLVGGTGFYIDAFLGETAYSKVPPDESLRGSLREYELAEWQKRLQKLDPRAWGEMNPSDRQNPRRLIRYIELAQSAGSVQKAKRRNRKFKNDHSRILKIGLRAPRESMYKRADNRAEQIVKTDALIRETQDLLNRDYHDAQLLTSMIYAPTLQFLQGKLNRIELVQTIQGQLHAYIRRQMRWFKRDDDIRWFDVLKSGYETRVEKLIAKWYSRQN